jgi:hypothetical protein
MKNGWGLKRYALISIIPVHSSDYFRTRMPLKKKKGGLRKERAARPKNKLFGPSRNKKDLNERIQKLNRRSVLNVRERFVVPYEAYEEEPRYVGRGGLLVVLREQVRFKFMNIVFYN